MQIVYGNRAARQAQPVSRCALEKSESGEESGGKNRRRRDLKVYDFQFSTDLLAHYKFHRHRSDYYIVNLKVSKSINLVCSTNNTVDLCLSTLVFLYINIYRIYIIPYLLTFRFISSFIIKS